MHVYPIQTQSAFNPRRSPHSNPRRNPHSNYTMNNKEKQALIMAASATVCWGLEDWGCEASDRVDWKLRWAKNFLRAPTYFPYTLFFNTPS